MEVKLDLMNKINCGDTLDLMKNIESNSVHLAITSPPYNVGKEYDEHNDLMMYEEYLDWLSEVWIETQRVLIDGGRFALNIGPTGIRDFKPLHHDLSNRLRVNIPPQTKPMDKIIKLSRTSPKNDIEIIVATSGPVPLEIG